MAQVLIQRVIDDLDGTDITDDVAGGRVAFGFQGSRYEIDLSAANYAQFEALLQPFIAAGRKIGDGRKAGAARATEAVKAGNTGRRKVKRQPVGKPRRARNAVDAVAAHRSEVRAWARANGYSVSDRGRISAELVAAFEAAQ